MTDKFSKTGGSMATIVDIVTQAIAPSIQAPYELVDVEYGKMGGEYVLSIFVDKEGGISLNDTAELSEVISPLLDTDPSQIPFPDQYMLEVTSPGLERPLKTAACCERGSWEVCPCQALSGH
jgi:ribosome maturation factor RimP